MGYRKKTNGSCKKLDENLPVDFVSTFMAAHAIPEECKENPDEFIEQVIEMLPKVKKKKT